MAFKKLTKQPPHRSEALAWGDNGPGLHGDEVAVQLDTGERVAVSVEPKWEPNNTGLALHAWARLIHADGSSFEDPTGAVDADGRPIVFETSVTMNVPASFVELYGEKALGREMMLAVLGEPPTMVKVAVDKKKAAADAAAAPAGTVLQPAAAEQAIIPMSEEARRNASIRSAIATMKIATGGINPADALGL